MIEIPVLLALIGVVIWAMRGGHSSVLEEPLVLDCPSRFHITLSPRLKHAQPFIEYIAQSFHASVTCGDCATQYFEVRDAGISMQEESYLLAACLRSGVLYFQAINSNPDGNATPLRTVREFSGAVMARHPLNGKSDTQSEQKLQDSVMQAVRQFKLNVIELHQD